MPNTINMTKSPCLGSSYTWDMKVLWVHELPPSFCPDLASCRAVRHTGELTHALPGRSKLREADERFLSTLPQAARKGEGQVHGHPGVSPADTWSG